MAGSLVLIQETTVSSPVSSVSLIGTNSSEFDVYFVQVIGVEMSSQVDMTIRFTVSGTADSSSNYDCASERLKASTSFGDISATNQAQIDLSVALGSNEQGYFNIYIFNANNSSEFTFCTLESVNTSDGSALVQGDMGGGVLTVTQATDGIQFFDNAGSANISSGTFKLYGLKK